MLRLIKMTFGIIHTLQQNYYIPILKVWHRLKKFKAIATRFGKQQRKTIRATISLIAIIVLFVVCNSVKVVVDGYRVVQVINTLFSDQYIPIYYNFIDLFFNTSYL